MRTSMIRACLAVGFASWACTALAQGESGAGGSLGTAMDDSRLASVRGGFDTGAGLLASFGLERVVYINGNLVVQTRLSIPDLGHPSAAQASALAAVRNTAQVVSNGPGNRFDAALVGQAFGATVIQNSLDHQRIQSMTTLTVGVRNLGLFDSLNLGQSLQSALIQSRGP